MSPEQGATLARLARLRDEIAVDRAAMERSLEDMGAVLERWGAEAPDRAYLALGAVALHGWYGALESTLERTARALDGSVPSGERWHRDLLSQAMVEIPTVRPAILRRGLLPHLVGLLEFRHFFRHAYGVELDPTKLQRNLDQATAIASEIDQALDRFERFLAEAMGSLTK